MPPDRNPLPFTPRPSPGGGEFEGFDVLGTAHFTRRSVGEAVAAASSERYSSVSIELDKQRFDELNATSLNAPRSIRAIAEGEFVAASDAFGNRDGDIWLIDIALGEIRSRIAPTLTASELRVWNEVSSRLAPYETAGIRLWEAGNEREAMRYLGWTTRAMERFSPTLHRALIEERNVIMAARLMEIAGVTKGKGLVLVGKAHVLGLGRLLAEPARIAEGFERYGLNYSPPVRVRRARVN
ncbi:MAG: TraB/GumN family protein [Nitrososphaerales archaeon]|nr:TraB/GumN family protein [Nitrososphaerales archaeon]